ncbi:MAG: glycoside hydrolase family 65, partial [Acidobacteriota bacterium]
MKRHPMSRRRFIGALASTSGLFKTQAIRGKPASIDRRALVQRHNPVVRRFDPLGPLSIGNGEFAFTADVTGLQTFSSEYDRTMPLCTMAQWGWHSTPLAANLDAARFRLTPFETFGRPVGYSVSSEGQTELYNWLRENPHRLHLGRIGLILKSTDGIEGRIADLGAIDQQLDLWSGTLTSRFEFQGQAVQVRTTIHPKDDLLAVAIESNLIREGRLAVRLNFPYGSPSMQAADWLAASRHDSRIATSTSSRADIERRLDADRYTVALQWETPARLGNPAAHEFVLTPAIDSGRLAFIVAFGQQGPVGKLPGIERIFAESAAHW